MRPKVIGSGAPIIHRLSPAPTPMKSETIAVPTIQPLSLASRVSRNRLSCPRLTLGTSSRAAETKGSGLTLMYRARKRVANSGQGRGADNIRDEHAFDWWAKVVTLE